MNAQTIMICSGKGGTGKSTVSVLLGAQLGAWSRRVLLIELDSGLRSVDMIAGVYGKTVYDIEDVLCGRCDGSKAIVPSPLYPGLSVISAPYEGGEVRAAPLAGLILAMREYFDYILLDTAAGMGAPFTAANRLADRALVVLTPDPVALRDGRIVADALLQSGRPASAVRLDNETLMQNICEVLDLDYDEIKDKLPEQEAPDPYKANLAAVQPEDGGGDDVNAET